MEARRAEAQGLPQRINLTGRHQIPHRFGVGRLRVFAALAVAQDAILKSIGFEPGLSIHFSHLKATVANILPFWNRELHFEAFLSVIQSRVFPQKGGKV